MLFFLFLTQLYTVHLVLLRNTNTSIVLRVVTSATFTILKFVLKTFYLLKPF